MTEAERRIQSPTPETLHFHLPAPHKKVKALSEYRSPTSEASADSPLDTSFPRSIPRSAAPSPQPFPPSLSLFPRELPPLPCLPGIKTYGLDPHQEKFAALEKQVKALEGKVDTLQGNVDQLMAEGKSDEATAMVDVQPWEIKQESDEESDFDLWALPQAEESPEQI